MSRKIILNATLSLLLSGVACGSHAATGLVTTFYDLAGTQLMLVTAGGLSCSVQGTTAVTQARLNTALSIVSAAYANGKQITLLCPTSAGVTQLTLN